VDWSYVHDLFSGLVGKTALGWPPDVRQAVKTLLTVR
jgi:hypothetical protein